MSLIEIDWKPKSKQLQNFGKIALVMTVIISLLLYLLKGVAIKWLLIILTKMIYLGMILLTMPIGWVVSFIVLAAFYYLLLAPLGLFFRLIGRDPLYRKFDSNAKSYWMNRRPPKGLEQYFHQF